MTALPPDAGMREAAAARDRERLQGAWNFVTGRRKVQLLIQGEQFTARFNSGEVYEGTFILDAMQKPKAMDMTIAAGPDHHTGRVAQCIYAIDGDHLVWCPGEPGKPARPQAFPPTDSQQLLCVVFRREKPALVGGAASVSA